MKKILATILIFACIIVAGIFWIRINQQETDITKTQTKVGFILNGTVDDHSWGESHYNGMEISAKELNLNIIYKENVPEDENSVEVMEELIADGCKIVICNSFGYGTWELECAKEHPEVYFFHATGVEQADNLATYFGRIYQMRYLSGIVAGMQTETNEIGYVAALPIAEVNRGIDAFALGVRSVNPEATVYVKWSNSWTGEEENAEATTKLIGEHNIDVLAMHTDAMAPLKIADENGIWTIGYNVDNSDKFPSTYLTAPVWNWECFYEPRILECLQGKFQGIHYWEGVETGIVDLAPLTENVKPGIAQKVEEARARLMSGTFDVFYGPVVDNEGNLRVKEGESMTDATMLNDFFWYVEGVVIDEAE
ncbi:MAG: BMP family ABC transporter substrate-binding protein [Lachnospiraceae bacterium]|nr:BMP family ABC transporter substrate-binding protein [Lachnospiraceae bacterium]